MKRALPVLLTALTLVLLLFLLPGCVRPNDPVLNDASRVASSIGRIDIETFYNNHSSLVDFTIYLILFVALAQLSLGKHLEGRQGKMVAIAIGLALSLGLVLMQRAMNFNIKSFGPIAALMMIAGVGLVVYLAIRKIGISIATSASIAIILMYYTIQALGPGLYEWIYQRAPWLTLLVLLCAIIAAVQIIRTLVERRRSPKFENLVGKTNKEEVQAERTYPEEKKKQKKQRTRERRLRKITRREYKDAKKLQAELLIIKHSIENKRPREEIIHHLKEVSAVDDDLLLQAHKTRQLTEQIRSLDLQQYDNLRNRFQGTKLQAARDNLRKQIHGELKKLNAEKRVTQYEKYIDEQIRHINNLIKLAINYLNGNEEHTAISILENAEKRAQGIILATKKMNDLEKELQRVSGIEVKKMRQEETVVAKKK